MPGYYLLNKKCVILPTIKNCKTYYSCQANILQGRLVIINSVNNVNQDII
jgi:hypothetical protein